MKRKVAERPVDPDDRRCYFDCCVKPDVMWQSLQEEEAMCENCGYEWTDSLL